MKFAAAIALPGDLFLPWLAARACGSMTMEARTAPAVIPAKWLEPVHQAGVTGCQSADKSAGTEKTLSLTPEEKNAFEVAPGRVGLQCRSV